MAWNVYIWFFIGMLIFSFLGRVMLYFKMPGTVGRLDIFEGFVGVCAIPAMWGFLQHRAIGLRLGWMLIVIVATALSIVQCFMPKTRKMFAAGKLRASGVKMLEAAIGLPGLYAVAYYAFLEPGLWK